MNAILFLHFSITPASYAAHKTFITFKFICWRKWRCNRNQPWRVWAKSQLHVFDLNTDRAIQKRHSINKFHSRNVQKKKMGRNTNPQLQSKSEAHHWVHCPYAAYKYAAYLNILCPTKTDRIDNHFELPLDSTTYIGIWLYEWSLWVLVYF